MVSAATMLIMLIFGGGLAVCIGIAIGAMLSSARKSPSGSLRCEQCGEYNRDDARFCARCGGILNDRASPTKP